MLWHNSYERYAACVELYSYQLSRLYVVVFVMVLNAFNGFDNCPLAIMWPKRMEMLNFVTIIYDRASNNFYFLNDQPQ
jgi:hypothetical protein